VARDEGVSVASAGGHIRPRRPGTAGERSETAGGAGGEAPAARQAKRSRTNDEGDPLRAFRGHGSPIEFVDTRGIDP